MILKKGWHVEFQGEEERGGVSKETVVLREHNKKDVFINWVDVDLATLKSFLIWRFEQQGARKRQLWKLSKVANLCYQVS